MPISITNGLWDKLPIFTPDTETPIFLVRPLRSSHSWVRWLFWAHVLIWIGLGSESWFHQLLTGWNKGHLCEELTHWKRLWCWEGLGAGGEGDDRAWDCWWHHWLDGHEFGWTLGVGAGQGGLACCDSWSRKESDTTEWLNWTESFGHSFLNYRLKVFSSWEDLMN